ncbi:hypothetical protein ACFX19_030090 [Malus domestica]
MFNSSTTSSLSFATAIKVPGYGCLDQIEPVPRTGCQLAVGVIGQKALSLFSELPVESFGLQTTKWPNVGIFIFGFCGQIVHQHHKNKTLCDLFPPAIVPSAKRFKSDSTASADHSLLSTTNNDSSSAASTDLTAQQKSRIEFQKLLAKARRNLSICSDRVSYSKSKCEGVKLEELLVEETWLEALPSELQKPYAKTLSKFVESELCGGVPIYPPTHLIFNALNSNSFDRVKAVILGQDPYHGPGQAMGLSFSVPEGVKVPSSLVNIIKEPNKDLGCSIPSHGGGVGKRREGVRKGEARLPDFFF